MLFHKKVVILQPQVENSSCRWNSLAPAFAAFRVNNGAALNNTILRRGTNLPHWENTSKDGGETRSRSVSVIPVVQVLQTCTVTTDPDQDPDFSSNPTTHHEKNT